MVIRVCRSSDEDADDLIQVTVKKELVEEKNRPLMKIESSQTNSKSELQSCKRKRVTSHSVEVNLESEVSSPTMVQAHRVQLSLGTQSATFMKLMSKSQVEGDKFPQLRLPLSFCRLYLPKDDTFTLEDEKKNFFEVKYSSKWMKFVAGWKNFAACQKLRETDVLLFHLVEPNKFKVNIIRADEHINANSSLVEQNGQGILESFDLSNPPRELRTFEDFKSKHVKLLSTGKIKLERKQSSPALLEANRIQLTKSPSFTKSIMKYVNDLRIPVSFCTLHLPQDETMMTLEDENEDQFGVKYIPKWKGFCAGWRKFITAHNLHEDDVLLFHLVDPKKFKVYITRVEDCQVNVNPNLKLQIEQGASESSDDLGTNAEFQFTELDDDTLKKYYELCCSKNDILHDKMLNLDSKLVATIISETVKIVDAVKSCDIFTPAEKLEQWVNLLKSFEALGMKVEFLVDRVSQLLKLRVVEGTQFDEIQILEGKHSELKDLYEKVGGIIERLKIKAEMHKVKFHFRGLSSSPIYSPSKVVQYTIRLKPCVQYKI